MLVLHAFSSFDPGGQETRFASIVGCLNPSLKHIVIAMDGRYGAKAGISAPNVKFLELPIKRGPGEFNFWLLRQSLNNLKPDHLVTYNFGALEWGISSVGLGLVHTHVEEGFSSAEAHVRLWRRNLLRRLVFNVCKTRLVTVSNAIASIANREWGVSIDKVVNIPNGVDSKRFVPRPLERQSIFARSPTEIVVGTAARLRPEKNLGRLIQAFAQLQRSIESHGLNARLVIAGDGDERERLQNLCTELGVAEKCLFLGHRNDLPLVLPEFDIFAMSSDTEQMPISLIEAMVAGLPAVATGVGDIPAILGAGNTRFVVPAEPAELANAITELILNKESRMKIGAENRERARSKFSKDAMVLAWNQIYGRSN